MKVAKTLKQIWNIYQKYDYMGEDYKYKNVILKDAPGGGGSMWVIYKGNKIEHLSVDRMSYANFSKNVRFIIKYKPTSTKDYFEKLDKYK